MPFYAVALRQARESNGVGLYRWSNVFYINAPDAFTAAVQGNNLWVDHLRNAARTDVYCYEVYATDASVPNSGPTPLTADYATTSIGGGFQRGNLAIGALGDAYWPDLCINVELQVVSSRPDRKYWRPGLREGDFNGQGQYVNAVLTQAIEEAFTGAVAATDIRSGDNELFGFASVSKAGVRRLGRTSRMDVPPPPAQG